MKQFNLNYFQKEALLISLLSLREKRRREKGQWTSHDHTLSLGRCTGISWIGMILQRFNKIL